MNRLSFLLSAAALLASCQQSPVPKPRADAAAVADCRAQADRVYAAQNRADLSRRDDLDNPFAAGYVSGIVTRGLGSQYQRDNLVESCLNANAGGAASSGTPGQSEGTTFNPARN